MIIYILWLESVIQITGEEEICFAKVLPSCGPVTSYVHTYSGCGRHVIPLMILKAAEQRLQWATS